MGHSKDDISNQEMCLIFLAQFNCILAAGGELGKMRCKWREGLTIHISGGNRTRVEEVLTGIRDGRTPRTES